MDSSLDNTDHYWREDAEIDVRCGPEQVIDPATIPQLDGPVEITFKGTRYRFDGRGVWRLEPETTDTH